MSDKIEVRVGDLVIDEKLTWFRPINEWYVSQYRQHYRAGVDMGEIIVEKNKLRVVSGNHRVTAMIREFGPDHGITVTAEQYEGERELLERFAACNLPNGNALDGKQRRAISNELIKQGASREEVASLFGVSVRRIEEWSGMTVMVIGGKSGKAKHPVPMPAKAGVEPGTTMSHEQYTTHWTHDRGVSAVSQAKQLARWIANGWIKDERSINALADLRVAIESLLSEKEKTA